MSGALAIDPESQFLPNFEERHSLRSHRNDGPTFWISSLARSAMLDDKTAETPDLDSLAMSHSFGHGIEDGVENDFRIAPREVRKLFVDFVNQVSLRHNAPTKDF